MTRILIAEDEDRISSFVAKGLESAGYQTLVLDDGTAISESVSICRYLESLHPTPPLFGETALEQATVDMWIRRIEFQLMTPVGMFWRHAHPLTAALLTQFQDFGESNREAVARVLRWLTAACTLASSTSRASVDLPEPDTPVTATSRCSGSWTLTDCRLCKVAVCTLSQPSAAAGSPVGAPATLVATLARAGSATGRRNCSGCFIACSK